MKRTILVMALALICAAPSMAQDKAGRGNRDPKKMSGMVAKKLQFNDDQMEKLDELNKKYPGSDFDKMKYREEFRSIMTEDQKKQMAALKAKREGTRGNRNANTQ